MLSWRLLRRCCHSSLMPTLTLMGSRGWITLMEKLELEISALSCTLCQEISYKDMTRCCKKCCQTSPPLNSDGRISCDMLEANDLLSKRHSFLRLDVLAHVDDMPPQWNTMNLCMLVVLFAYHCIIYATQTSCVSDSTDKLRWFGTAEVGTCHPCKAQPNGPRPQSTPWAILSDKWCLLRSYDEWFIVPVLKKIYILSLTPIHLRHF